MSQVSTLDSGGNGGWPGARTVGPVEFYRWSRRRGRGRDPQGDSLDRAAPPWLTPSVISTNGCNPVGCTDRSTL